MGTAPGPAASSFPAGFYTGASGGRRAIEGGCGEHPAVQEEVEEEREIACVRGVRLCPWNERGLATGKGSKGSEAKKDWGFQSPLVWTTFIDIEIAPLHLVLFILSVDCRAHVAKTNCWKMKRGTREMREGQMGPHIHEGQKAARRRSIEMTVAKKITLLFCDKEEFILHTSIPSI